jgi:hypothetical protein
MKIEIFNGNWSLDDVNKDPKKIFIFGDNNIRIGKGGQAIIRDLPNTIGIRTKKGPSTKQPAYYTDEEFSLNCKNILEDILNIKSHSMIGRTIVFSSGGYGTGLALLNEKAPKTFQYLSFLLREHFNFDNKKGKKWFKIPGHDEIIKGNWIDFDKDINILKPVNNSFFNPNLLKNSINTTFDLIRTENKVAFTSNKKYNNGEIVIFKFNNNEEYVVCRIIESYNLLEMPYLINDYKWHLFEGYDKTFDISKLNIDNKYQTHFQFICTMDDSGKMIFKNDLFSKSELVDEDSMRVIGDPIISKIEKKENKKMENKKMSNEELTEAVNSINKRIDLIYEKFNKLEKTKKFNFLKKKSLEDLLLENEIKGELKKINEVENIYEVETDEFIYYLKHEIGIFENEINILIKKQK